MPFHIDSRKRTRRTKVLAGATTDAPLDIDSRYLQRFRVSWVGSDHFNSIRGTMTGAVTALDTVG